MTTLKIDIENEQNISAIKEILSRFNVSYQVENQKSLSGSALEFYEDLKAALQQVQLPQNGKIQLKTLKQSLADFYRII